MPHIFNLGKTVVSDSRVEWIILHFFKLGLESNYCIQSTEFLFKGETFRLELFPKGFSGHETEGWMGIHLKPANQNMWPKYTAEFSISGLNQKNSRSSYSKNNRFWGLSDYRVMRWNALENNRWELAPNGHLKILCQFRKEECEMSSTDEPEERKSHLNEASFLDDFGTLFETGEFSDFDVKVQDRIFQTHKVVLAARSSVFASMLRHDMKEKQTGMVEIVDCDPDTFEVFLKFLYGGKYDLIDPKNAISLYEVANKYEVQSLKAECCRFMMENLSTELFCDVLCLALKHEERELIKHATEYFRQNKKNIFVSVEWQIFFKEYSTYANELLIKTCD